MVLYLDTSALVKLYLNEPAHEQVSLAVRHASSISTSMVAYAESRSAFARRYRENALTTAQHREIVQAFDAGWLRVDRIPLYDDIAYTAGDLAEQHALRGFDAIHLSSAIWMSRRLPDLLFLTYDVRLMDAARQVVPVYETG